MQETERRTPRIADSYFFVSHWRVKGLLEEVFTLLKQPERLPLWWPSVYLAVEELQRGERNGIGRQLALKTKGWLPYTLNWVLEVTEVLPNEQLSLRASGDLEGRGTWMLAQDGDYVNISYEWEVMVHKPLLKQFAPLFKPVFALNHRWAMAQGQTSLALELQRLKAKSYEDALKVPAPPGPEPEARAWAILGGGAILALLICWMGLRAAREV